MFSRILASRASLAVRAVRPVCVARQSQRLFAQSSSGARQFTDLEVESAIAMSNPTSDVADKLAQQNLNAPSPSDFIANHYIDWLYSRGQADKALEHFEAFRAKATPSWRMYHGAIRSASQAKNPAKAQQYFDMWKADGKTQPTAHAYAVLIGSTIADPKADPKEALTRAQALFEEAKAKFPATESSLLYHGMYLVATHAGRQDLAQQLINELKEKGGNVNPLTLRSLAYKEFIFSLPKLKKKKRTEKQVSEGKTITGAKFVQGIELLKVIESQMSKLAGKELARRSQPPKRPDSYIEAAPEDYPEDWDDADKAEANKLIKEHNTTIVQQAIAEQKKPKPPRLPRLPEEEVKQIYNPTFYRALHVELRLLNDNPSKFGLSQKAQESVKKYFASLLPKKK